MIVKFKASLPPIKSAILLDGLGDGGQIKLEISRKYVHALLDLQKMGGKEIQFTATTERYSDSCLVYVSRGIK